MKAIVKSLVNILRSYSFRYSSKAVVILSVVVMFMLAIVYGIFSYNLFHDVHGDLSVELDHAVVVYTKGGGNAINDYIREQQFNWGAEHYAYLLVDKDLNKLLGSLDEWPQFAQYGDGWLSFELEIFQAKENSEDHKFVARSIQLADGNQLLVAQSYEHIFRIIRFVLAILLNGFFFTVFIGLIGAFYVSWNFLSRLDQINKSIDKIVNGDLSERISVEKQATEIEMLAQNLNSMLDKIVELMAGVKQVSDSIAHDLRTPLTRLRNKLATYEQNCSVEEKPVIRELIDEADGLFATFNALLRIARIELGESVQRKTINLEHLVGEVIELYEPLASEKNIIVDVKLQEASIMGDRNLIFQAVVNVLDNAIKYTPEHGEIGIFLTMSTVSNKEKNVVLEISDTGCGIKDINIKNIFRRFYREESSRSMLPGNGLGLSLVEAVMKIHTADVVISNKLPHGLRVLMCFSSALEDENGKQFVAQSEISTRDNFDVSTLTSR